MKDDQNTAVHVNFGKPIPLFPIDGLVLLPQQVIPLHIFEERYRQMMSHVLDGAGQIAMALFLGDSSLASSMNRPALREHVCVGQIVQHETLDDGRYNILLQGVCRARLRAEVEPTPTRLFREAMLEPIERNAPDEPMLQHHREWLERELGSGKLSRLSSSEDLLEYVRNDEVPKSILMELLSFTLLGDVELRYGLLAEADAGKRAELVRNDLERMRNMIRLADQQGSDQWPKGVSWN